MAISVENHQFPPPRVFNAPAEGVPLEFGIGARGPECFCASIMGLPEGQKVLR